MALGIPSNAVTSGSTGGQSSMIITLPTHNEGDLLLVHVAQDDVVATDFVFPVGWIEAVPFTQSNSSFKGAYKFAGASEPATITVLSDDSDRWNAIAWKVSGADVPETAGVNTGDSQYALCPSVTPSSTKNIIIRAGFTDGDTPGHTLVDHTLIAERSYEFSASVSAFYRTWNSNSETGTASIDLQKSEQWAGATYIIPEAIDELSGVGITVSPTTDQSEIGQTHNLVSTDIMVETVSNTPTLAILYELEAAGIATTSIVDISTLSSTHQLISDGFAILSIVDSPTLWNGIELIPTGIQIVSESEISNIGQTHELVSNGVVLQTYLSSPEVRVLYELVSNGLIASSTIDSPTLKQILQAGDILVRPLVGMPIAKRIHILNEIRHLVIYPKIEYFSTTVRVIFEAYPLD